MKSSVNRKSVIVFHISMGLKETEYIELHYESYQKL